MKIVRGWKHLACKRRMGELGQLILEKRMFSEALTSMFQYLLGRSKEERDRLFFIMPDARTGSHGRKFKYGKFCLSVSKIKNLYCTVVKHWKRQYRVVVMSSFLKDTQNQGGHDPGRPAS